MSNMTEQETYDTSTCSGANRHTLSDNW